jgi:dihydropyrimidine dehydrogenase (NAD+) subunit PreT
MEQEEVFHLKTLKAPAVKKAARIACVGAGPASLACAAALAKAGYRVTIFEAEEKAGGMLTYGVTPARLPQHVVNRDIAAVRGLGVRFVFRTKVGPDINIEDLMDQGFSAVFIGVGLWKSKLPDIEGMALDGVCSAIDFLKNARSTGGRTGLKGKSVIVIGGGDVAMDCATTAKLTGAERVAIYYRRSVEEAPANIDERHYALSLGVSIAANFAPARLVGDGGKLTAVEFRGRDGKSFASVAADVVVFATGQTTTEDISEMAGLKLTKKGTVRAIRYGKDGFPGVFAGGDAVNGGGTAVEAVAAGKEAAAEMIIWLERMLRKAVGRIRIAGGVE